ncbi:MAG: glycosyltransferase family 4 protein [Lachnospiraceae bacterium]|nr:glycosyltransferase family 4 protein [Lachnospiraceae bacterium]
MKITMISNYINHHQIPFSQALYERLGEGYRFIQTEPMEKERIAMGWGLEAERLPYMVFMEKNPEYVRELIAESDVLLLGWNNCEELFTSRLGSNKLTIRISERLYREGQWKAISPRGLVQKYKEHIRYRNNPVYLLCNGACVASDFSLIKAYPGKKFKFGYFPETKSYSLEELRKNHDWGEVPGEKELQLIWAGRFLPLKHPEFALRLADELKQKGYSFHLHMIGGGELEEELKAYVQKAGLQNTVTFYGFLPPEEVRLRMENCHIHLFTSNHLEGWGAVVNEAMNSGCTVVGSSRAGAVPFLIRPGENGLVYEKDDFHEFVRRVEYLFDHPQEGSRMGLAAYQTIAGEWNAETAAGRLLDFYEQWKAGKITPPKSGPFSVAENRRGDHV